MALIRLIPRGDLELVSGNLVILRGLPYIRQKLAVRFKFFAREWFLDLRLGLPWFSVLGARPNLFLIRSLLRRVCLTTPGVVTLRRFELRYFASERLLAVNFEAVCDGNELLIVEPEDQEFLVDLAA